MSKIICSASDPGGGNAVVPVVKVLRAKGFDVLCIVGERSKDIFQKAGLEYIDADVFPLAASLDVLVAGFSPGIFIAGSSFGSTIDKRILLCCRERHIPSIYILDFWVNYWQRFSDNKKDFKYLSDFVCVMDKFAKNEMKEEGFPESRLIITGNPFFDHFVDGIKHEDEDRRRILFISQPLRSFCEHPSVQLYGYDEYSVLNDIIKVLTKVSASCTLVVRLHPKDEPHKFDAIIASSAVTIELDSVVSVEESLSQSRLVIGMNSMVLFQAAVAGKIVWSYQPSLQRKDPLVSNRLGISCLITDVDTLYLRIKEYFNNNLESISTDRLSGIIKNATDNVVKFIIAHS